MSYARPPGIRSRSLEVVPVFARGAKKGTGLDVGGFLFGVLFVASVVCRCRVLLVLCLNPFFVHYADGMVTEVGSLKTRVYGEEIKN